MAPIVTINPKVMHATPCFAGTRVDARSLFDHLEAGYSVDEFLEEFPTVSREQVMALLEQSQRQAVRNDSIYFNGAYRSGSFGARRSFAVDRKFESSSAGMLVVNDHSRIGIKFPLQRSNFHVKSTCQVNSKVPKYADWNRTYADSQ